MVADNHIGTAGTLALGKALSARPLHAAKLSLGRVRLIKCWKELELREAGRMWSNDEVSFSMFRSLLPLVHALMGEI